MSLSSARLNQTVIVLVSFFLVPPPDIQIVKVAQRKVSRETPRGGGWERKKNPPLSCFVSYILCFVCMKSYFFFCINWKIISLKRANLHLTFITFYSNISLLTCVVWKLNTGFGMAVRKVWDICWIFVKKEQERRIRIPPSRIFHQNFSIVYCQTELIRHTCFDMARKLACACDP